MAPHRPGKSGLVNAFRFAALCAALVASNLGASPVPSPRPSAAATPSARARAYARALDWFHRLQSGQIDRKQLTEAFDEQLTGATVRQVKAQLDALGDPTSIAQEPEDDRFGVDAYIYDITFKNGSTYAYYFVVDASGKIAGIRLIAKSTP